MWRRLFHRQLKTLSSIDAYALWSQSYLPQSHNPLMAVEQAAMIDLMPSLEGCTVLDLACGSGRYSRIALEHGAAQVIGVDNSTEMLTVGRRELPEIEFTGATVEAIPLGTSSVDVILCGLALGHLRDLERTLSEMARVMTTGGFALISDFHPFLALSGKQRTFTAPDGRVFAIEHYPHLFGDMLSATQRNGLTIEHITEPRLTIDVAEMPAVIVYRLRKN